jgi:hypothetical protein
LKDEIDLPLWRMAGVAGALRVCDIDRRIEPPGTHRTGVHKAESSPCRGAEGRGWIPRATGVELESLREENTWPVHGRR